MGYYHLILPRENAWEVMNRLGKLEILHFTDMNSEDPSFKREFHNNIRRCEEFEANLDKLEYQMRRFEVPVTRCVNPERYAESLDKFMSDKTENSFFLEAEYELNERVGKLHEQLRTYDELLAKREELQDYFEVLGKSRSLFDSERSGNKAGMNLNENGG